MSFLRQTDESLSFRYFKQIKDDGNTPFTKTKISVGWDHVYPYYSGCPHEPYDSSGRLCSVDEVLLKANAWRWE